LASPLSMQDLFDIANLLHAEKFSQSSPFDYLGKKLSVWLNDLLDSLNVGDTPCIRGDVSPLAHVVGRVYVAPGAVVEPYAMITGPCYIGPESEVRHAAYIRGNVYVGKDCVVGHTTEVKGSLFLDGAKAGHFAYVGDSILGRNTNLGAGTKLANLKFRGDEVLYKSLHDQSRQGSGLRKLGALMGDDSQTGCNAVLDPGSILCRSTVVMSSVHFRGTLLKGIALK